MNQQVTKTIDLKSFGGLSYLTIKQIPLTQNSRGREVVEAAYIQAAENQAAVAILNFRIPIRGAELKFFRKVLGLSLAEFAEHIGMSPAGLLKWEKSKETRLSYLNEIAIRVVLDKLFKIEEGVKLKDCSNASATPKEIQLTFEQPSDTNVRLDIALSSNTYGLLLNHLYRTHQSIDAYIETLILKECAKSTGFFDQHVRISNLEQPQATALSIPLTVSRLASNSSSISPYFTMAATTNTRVDSRDEERLIKLVNKK